MLDSTRDFFDTLAKVLKFVMECGNIQPGRKIFSDEFYVGVADSGVTTLIGHFYAENLPEPKEFTLIIDADITKTTMTLEELIELADGQNNDECEDD